MWIVYALCAAVFWGLSYTYSEQVLRKISVSSLLLMDGLACLTMALTAGLITKSVGRDWDIIKKGELPASVLVTSIVVYSIATLFIIMSIKAKNATMAGLIEISYPIFTALFAWLIFKETQFNAGTIAGAVLIFSGVICVYIFGKTV